MLLHEEASTELIFKPDRPITFKLFFLELSEGYSLGGLVVTFVTTGENWSSQGLPEVYGKHSSNQDLKEYFSSWQ